MRVDITVGNFKECLRALGKKWFDYSVYGESCLSHGERIDCISECTGMEFDDDIDIYDIDICNAELKEESLLAYGRECLMNGVDYQKTLASYVMDACLDEYRDGWGYCLGGSDGFTFTTIEVDEALLDEFVEESDDSWEQAFFEPIEHLFVVEKNNYRGR